MSGCKVAYVASINRASTPLTFVWNNACFNGYNNAYRPLPGDSDANDFYWGRYGLYSCYETYYDNDMATCFGICTANFGFYACGYVGWYDYGWFGGAEAGDWDSGAYNGDDTCNGLCADTFGYLASGSGDGFPFYYIPGLMQQWHGDYFQPHQDYPVYDKNGNLLGDMLPPAANWRFWGTEMDSLFQ